jgi:type IV pilus assembly protein PilA
MADLSDINSRFGSLKGSFCREVTLISRIIPQPACNQRPPCWPAEQVKPAGNGHRPAYYIGMQTVIKQSNEIGNKKQKGFSLIELLIVVAIILIIAAIAIPNLLRSRMAANEASAVGSIRTINTSAVTYSTTYPNAGFPATLASLGGATPCTATSTNSCLLDQVLAGGTKSGYIFALTTDGNTPSVGYSITGTPVSVGTTGQRMFFSDQSGVIRYSATGAGATAASPALQ